MGKAVVTGFVSIVEVEVIPTSPAGGIVTSFAHYARVPESDDPGFRPAIGLRA